MRKWKKIQKQLDEAKHDINLLSRDNIKLKYELETSDARMNIGGGSKNAIEDALEEQEVDIIYNQIMQNRMPKEFAFDYLRMSQQIDMFWLGRYSNFEHQYKRSIKTALLIAIRYGLGGYCKSNHKPYYITKSEIHPDTHWTCYPAYDLFHDDDAFDPVTRTLSKEYLKTHEGKEIAKDDIVIATWRYGNMGNFVYYMKDLLMWLYVYQLVLLNASSMINKLYVKVNNLVNFKKEYRRLLDPFKQVAYIISDNDIKPNTAQNITGDANKIMNGEIGKHGMDGNIAQLISTSKYLLETFCWMYGIPITSSKSQDLSSEASFSHSTSRNIAQDHDDRVAEFYKELGITLEIEEPEALVTENQNADKKATGTANTENDKNERKAANNNGNKA